jgi:hypothetical protein
MTHRSGGDSGMDTTDSGGIKDTPAGSGTGDDLTRTMGEPGTGDDLTNTAYPEGGYDDC